MTKLVSIGRRTEVTTPPDLVALLLECHERIRTFAGIAVDVARRSDLSSSDVAEACRRCIRYFEQALPLHVLDEERSLLPRLSQTNEEVRAALTAMHNQHHAHEPQLVEFLAGLRDLEQDPLSGDARARLEPVAVELAAQFEDHLVLEERVIFPAIREHLSVADQTEVLAELRARRQ
ncbi:MAG TPA: hemerythrin domain-containing protein [Polyangiaceae bacterium]|nr:hemerythrin domain-containing protein [Polyangiaceae bacterium]